MKFKHCFLQWGRLCKTLSAGGNSVPLKNVKKLYIISGCNGAGKTTASYTILPHILDCKEFVNADEIARGLSPFHPGAMNIQAGRLMLKRIKHLMEKGKSFAFETTLATKSYVGFLKTAKSKGYELVLLYFWLSSQELAIKRVRTRVLEGGHAIADEVVRRRYDNGLKNFFNRYRSLADNWLFVDNSGNAYEIVAENINGNEKIINREIWTHLKEKYNG